LLKLNKALPSAGELVEVLTAGGVNLGRLCGSAVDIAAFPNLTDVRA